MFPDFKQAITINDLKKIDFNEIDDFNFKLLAESIQCFESKDNILDACNKIKFILNSNNDTHVTLVVTNLLFLLYKNILKNKNLTEDQLYVKFSAIANSLAHFNDLEKMLGR